MRAVIFLNCDIIGAIFGWSEIHEILSSHMPYKFGNYVTEATVVDEALEFHSWRLCSMITVVHESTPGPTSARHGTDHSCQTKWTSGIEHSWGQ